MTEGLANHLVAGQLAVDPLDEPGEAGRIASRSFLFSLCDDARLVFVDDDPNGLARQIWKVCEPTSVENGSEVGYVEMACVVADDEPVLLELGDDAAAVRWQSDLSP
ncbi:hypothetical protein [Bosea sp. TND4EK4]|uniref:hypothetical protein n=1 Tax=Bosea sp. TND4EK4 TaxID=1907408 RepID=UPI001AECA645|nr:hypothetical protein [Bosea sp. TND4EK4]